MPIMRTNRTDITLISQNHDTYTLGQFHDDQLRNHGHSLRKSLWGYIQQTGYEVPDYYNGYVGSEDTGWYTGDVKDESLRVGSVTRGKRKGVIYLIKVL